MRSRPREAPPSNTTIFPWAMICATASVFDPTGAHVGGVDSLYTAGDLAAAMAVNLYIRVFSANVYHDAVTPFFQTILNFGYMPLDDPQARQNFDAMIGQYSSRSCAPDQ